MNVVKFFPGRALGRRRTSSRPSRLRFPTWASCPQAASQPRTCESIWRSNAWSRAAGRGWRHRTGFRRARSIASAMRSRPRYRRSPDHVTSRHHVRRDHAPPEVSGARTSFPVSRARSHLRWRRKQRRGLPRQIRPRRGVRHARFPRTRLATARSASSNVSESIPAIKRVRHPRRHLLPRNGRGTTAEQSRVRPRGIVARVVEARRFRLAGDLRAARRGSTSPASRRR